MAGWLPQVLTTIHELAAQRCVEITVKAKREMFELGVEDEDVISVLMELTGNEFKSAFTRSQTMTSGCTSSKSPCSMSRSMSS